MGGKEIIEISRKQGNKIKQQGSKRKRKGDRNTSAWYLFSLNHLLVKVIREGSQGAKLSRALGTRENAIFIDQTTTADGDQGYAVTTEAFIQVHVSSLDLVIHRNGPAGRDGKERVTWLNQTNHLQTAEIKATVRQAGRWMDGSSFILGSLGVPDHYISICSCDDPPFPRVEVVDLGCVWACDCYKAILIHLTSDLWILTKTQLQICFESSISHTVWLRKQKQQMFFF